MINRVIGCIGITLVCVTTLFMGKVEPIAIRLYPQVGNAPLAVNVVITVPRNEENRGACLMWDGDVGSAGSSCWTLNGDREPITVYYTIKHLMPGEYQVFAELTRTDKTVKSNIVDVRVVGGF